LRLQRVSGKYGDGFAEGFVAGGASAAQVVVIERGQIVVDQGICVKHFERGADSLDASGERAGRRCRCDHASRFHAQDRTQAFAPGKHAVAHGLMDRRRMLGSRRQESLEGGVGGFPSLFKNLFQHDIAV
jgi:hypothetical protein